MATPANRIPVRVARGAYADLNASIADLYEGEICYATDQDQLYVVESGVLVATVTNEIVGLDDIPGVDLTTTPPITGDHLEYDGSFWVPAPDVGIASDTVAVPTSVVVNNLVTMSQANYDALGSYDANTVYIIV